jgi:hypothetical protein
LGRPGQSTTTKLAEGRPSAAARSTG